MNVKQLKEILEKLPDYVEVILSSDPEGNSYSPLANTWDKGMFVAGTSEGELYGPEDKEEYSADEWKEILIESKPCVVFWP